MLYKKYQFKEKQTPEFLVNYIGCSFCQGSIKEKETYFQTTEGWGVDIINICERCYQNKTI